MEFRERRDEPWAFIEPLLPPKARTGRPRADDRKTRNRILSVLTTGCRWMDRPAKDGSDGLAEAEGMGSPGGWEDRGGQKRGEEVGFDGDRRRKGTKVHAVVTAQGAPVGIEGTSAQKPEGVVFSRLLRRASVGRRTRPREVAGDGSSDSRSIRAELRRRGRWAWRSVNPRNRRGSRRGRPYRFDPDTDRVLRGAVERFFAWLKGGFRRLARRHERLLATFRGFVHLAGFLITWRVLR